MLKKKIINYVKNKEKLLMIIHSIFITNNFLYQLNSFHLFLFVKLIFLY